MATVNEQPSRWRGRSGRTPLGPEQTSAVARQSLFAILLGRMIRWLSAWIAPVGRFSLYAGLLLVTLTAIRLPGETGSIADVFLLLSMACATLLLLQGHPLRIGLLKTHLIGVGLIVAGIVVSTLAESTDDWQSLLRLTKFLFATTAMIVTSMVLLEQRHHVKVALGCWVVSAMLTSLAAILQAGFGEALMAAEISGGRMPGLSQNANGLGTVAAMAIPGALTLGATSNRLKGVLWLLATLLCICGVVVSASRSGAIVAAVSLVVWAAAFYRIERNFTIVVVGFCLAGAAVAGFVYVQFWTGADVTDRLAKATNPYAASAVAERLFQYQDVLRDASQNPFLGVGLGEREIEVDGKEIHNTFLLLLRAGGLLAVAGMALILGDFLVKGVHTYFHSNSMTRKSLGIGLSIGVLGMQFAGLAGPLLYQREKWVPAALLLSLLARHRSRSLPSEATITPPARPGGHARQAPRGKRHQIRRRYVARS